MLLKLRPFIGVQFHESLDAEGRIDEGKYFIRLGGFTVPISTSAIEQDTFGSFALVEEQVHKLELGYLLTVERLFDETINHEGVEAGASITVLKKNDDPRIKEFLQSQDLGPSNANIVIPPLFSTSVDFNCDGFVSGCGGVVPNLVAKGIQ